MKMQASLPQGWTQLKLGELHRDDSKGINPAKFRDETFELYSVPSHANRVPELVQGNAVGSNKITVTPDTLLLCKINPRINRTWITGSFSSYRKIASTEWIPFAPINGMCMAYLAFFMQQNQFRDYLSAHASGVGGSLMRVRPATFSDYVVPLPPLPEQRRIVAKIEELFTRLDAGIAALQTVKRQIKRYRQAVLRDAFTGELTREWRERKLRKPGAWSKAQLGDVTVLITKGSSPNWQGFDYCAEGVVFVRSQNVGWGKLELTDVAHLPLSFNAKEKKSILHEGDVLVNIVGASIGRVALADQKVEGGNVNQAVATVRLNPERAFGPYIMHYLLSPSAQAHMHSEKVDVARANISLDDLKHFPVPLPDLPEQRQVVREVDRHFSLADSAEKAVDESLAKAEHLRQSILKQAFEGKLVPQDPNDEPAERLEERIKTKNDQKAPKERRH